MARATVSPAFKIRGLMLDPGRQTERHEFYFDLLPQLAAWGFNTLWWHFCDDEGFALKLDSHPELASPYAFSKAQTRRFVRAAADVGITVVPEVESLGHALFITRLPQYAHLFVGHPFGHNAVAPSHPQSLRLMKDIIEEVADLFGGEYLHAGLDEANFGDDARCRRLARGRPPYALFLGHALAIHKIVASCGKRMIIWADPVEHHPALLRKLPKDIVLAHWHYGKVPAERITPSVKAGFQIVCVPAMGGLIVQPSALAFQNTDDMVALSKRLRRRGCLGVVSSWWESFRNLRDTYPLIAAYVGRALRTGEASGRVAFARSFAREYFGLRDAAAARALWQIHELVLDRTEVKALMYDSLADVHEALGMASADGFDERLAEAGQCVAALRSARRKVKAHKDEYAASLLAGQVLVAALRNGQQLREVFRLYRRAADHADYQASRPLVAEMLGAAAEALAKMQDPIDRIAGAVDKEWDRTRYARDPKKDGSSPLLRQRGARAPLKAALRCRDYHRALVKGLRRAIAAYRRGGPFPAGL